jgi:hypothetical protein
MFAGRHFERAEGAAVIERTEKSMKTPVPWFPDSNTFFG